MPVLSIARRLTMWKWAWKLVAHNDGSYLLVKVVKNRREAAEKPIFSSHFHVFHVRFTQF